MSFASSIKTCLETGCSWEGAVSCLGEKGGLVMLKGWG